MNVSEGINQHLNFLSANRAVLNIHEIPNTSFSLVGFSIPTISLPPPSQPSPYFERPEYGETLKFSSLNVEFNVTSRLENWMEIYNWMNALGAPRDKSTEFAPRKFTYSDATVTLYNSHNNPVLRVHFKDCVPVDLGGINFNEAIQTTDTIKSNLELQYWHYDIEFV